MADPKDDEAVNAAARAHKVREAQRREKALEALRGAHAPISSEPGTVLPGVVTGTQFDEVAAVVDAMLADPECFVVIGLAGDHEASEKALARFAAEGFASAYVVSGTVLVAELPDVEGAVGKALAAWPEGKALSTIDLAAALGKGASGGLLAGAAPIVVPAIADSALGAAVSVYNTLRRRQGLRSLVVDPLLDLEAIGAKASGMPNLGLLTIGGGAPRAFADQIAPWLERRKERLGEGSVPHVRYDVRVGPDTWVALAERVLGG